MFCAVFFCIVFFRRKSAETIDLFFFFDTIFSDEKIGAKRIKIMKKGFTLIELLIVVLIIGILSAVALPQYRKAVEKSKITEGLYLLKRMMQEKDIYYMANGQYPASFDVLGFETADLSLKHWNVDNRMSSKRFQLSHKTEHYFQLINYFSSQDMYCQVLSSWPENNYYRSICKMFGSEKIVCPGESNFHCYKIQ